jgi:hypothetical protein
MLLENVLKPVEPYFVTRPAVIAYGDRPVKRNKAVCVPARLMHNSLKDNKRRCCNALYTNSLDNSHPLAIAWLRRSWPTSSIATRNDLRSSNNAHLKARFVEVIDIAINDTVLRNSIA